MPAGKPHTVWYVEWRSPTAQAALCELLRRLPQQSGFVGAEVQVSAAQPELALLVSRWVAAPPVLAVPPGAKQWHFEVIAAAPDEGQD